MHQNLIAWFSTLTTTTVIGFFSSTVCLNGTEIFSIQKHWNS